MRDIQVFLGFANFYWYFIEGFIKIAAPLISMLITTQSAKNLLLSMAEDDEVGSVNGVDCDDKTVEKSLLISKNLNGAIGYLTLEARLAFAQLRKTFTKAPILQHFDLKCHIRIETHVSGYAIGEILSQLTLDNLDWWHPVAFYLQKIIPAETWYEIHDGELLTIIEAFKTCRHYLKDCKHEVLVLIDHNNLRRFMDTKNLSFT